MSTKHIFLGVLALFYTLSSTAQKATISGTVLDQTTNEALIGATVQIDGEGTITDIDGAFSLEVDPGAYQLIISFIGFSTQIQPVNLSAGENQTVNILLQEESTLLNTITVTSGKHETRLSEVTVSLDVLQPGLIENTSKKTLDEALNKIPGVNIIDGQANIRGGSGYSYGAGSRVLLLQDDVPILQADAGFPNWDDVPIENIDQVEVVKGAASALYGSAALNGIINVRTAYAKSEPETKISTFYTHQFKPEDQSKAWWDNAPGSFASSITHKRKIDRLDLVFGGFYLNDYTYNKDTYKKYGRFNFNTRYRVTDRMTIGLSGNFNKGKSGSFFYWGGADSPYAGAPTTLGVRERFRFNLDPTMTLFDQAGNRHKVLSRFYRVDNQNSDNQSNQSTNLYGEYQFQREFKDIGLILTAGFVAQGSFVSAELYGDTTFTSRNLATFFQFEKRFFDKLNVSAGFRYENNFLDNPGFSYLLNGKEEMIAASEDQESKPVFRLGLSYQLAEFTFLRASTGQGYRYPSIAEKYIFTDAGGFFVTPNPDLTSETGWSAELAIKQGFKISSFRGFVDAAVFLNRYEDMIEFNLIPGGFSFQAVNIGGTEIKGVEFSIMGQGSFFGLETNLLAGYTRIDPRYELFDAEADRGSQAFINANNSTHDDNILKYRPRHTFKADLETGFKNFRLGWEGIFNSKTEAIDITFLIIIPGFGEYFVNENSGYFLHNFRMAYSFNDAFRISAILNNTFNREYLVRPGLLGAPRNLTLRADFNF